MGIPVAVDVAPLLGPGTGIGQATRDLVDALRALPEPPEILPYVLSFRAKLPDDVIRLPYPAGVALRAWGRFDHPRARRSLRAAAVVHGTNFVVPPTGLPSVVTVHDCSFVTRPELVNTTVRRFAPIVRRAVDAGAWVHVPSAYTAGQVRDLFATDRVRVVPHGRPTIGSPDGPGLPGLGGRPYILAIGTREPRKNLPRLVDAFGLVSAQHPDLALVLVGAPGPDQEHVDAAIARLPRTAARQVLLTDWVLDEHRTAALARASVLAYPSLDEGFGLPLLEAMQLGVPIVAAAAGSIPEVAGDAALLVDPADTEAIAAGLVLAVGDDATRQRLVDAGRRRVAEFSWPTAAAAIDGLYRDAAKDAA